MLKNTYKTWVFAGLLLCSPWFADAAGFGKLTILSSLGQPLRAEIELVAVQSEELATLSARLAAPEAFRAANIQYNPALAGARVTLEKRADGQPFVRIVSSRVLNEPFIDLLVEVSWAQGRLVREYTALIDPPGFGTADASVTPSVAPPPVAGESVTPPSEPVAVGEPPSAAASSSAAAPTTTPRTTRQAAGSTYAVKHGDTLAKIAAQTKPQEVTLEQMLVSLYRNNPDAFSGNMNQLKSGKILRVPQPEQIAETTPGDALKEIHVQAANWNAYRQRLAQAAAASAPEAKSAASGKIVTAAEDKAAGKEAPKEVLKLSKSEASSGSAPGASGSGGLTSAERQKAREDEALAREKALTEANDRIAQLEKTVAGMQRLLELKGQTARNENAKSEPGAPSAPGASEPPKSAAPVAAVAPTAPQAGPASSQPPKVPLKVVPPPPAPNLVDQILREPLYLGGIAAGVIALFAGGIAYSRRRRLAESAELDERLAPTMGAAPDTDVHAADVAPVVQTRVSALAADDVDPLAEAELYLNFGRDVQAEEVLKEALEKNPKNEEAQLKLLHIYAGRRDKDAFEKVARGLNSQTSGSGERWQKAAAMGYAFDAENALYAAGRSAAASVLPAAISAAIPELDFDLDLAHDFKAPDTMIEFGLGDAEKTMIVPREMRTAAAAQPSAADDITDDSGTVRGAAEAEPDFVLDKTLDKVERTVVDAAPAAPMANVIDFDADAGAVIHTMPTRPEQVSEFSGLEPAAVEAHDSAPAFDGSARLEGPHATLVQGGAIVSDLKFDSGSVGAGPTFSLDDIDLDLDIDTAPKAAVETKDEGAKDDHWYDVQTKFDLAKAYQEMGDKDGAREILQEVIVEGDSDQKTEAKQLLDTLV